MGALPFQIHLSDPQPVLIKRLKGGPYSVTPMRFIPHRGRAGPVFISQIKQTVSEYYGNHINYMTSEHRAHDVSHPRQVAMYLARELTRHSLPAIGRQFGDRDHTTVLHACKAVQTRIETDPKERAAVEALRRMLDQ
jgi:chromosomal replication initiation ATPase DnaA